jgi:hypothetical protein
VSRTEFLEELFQRKIPALQMTLEELRVELRRVSSDRDRVAMPERNRPETDVEALARRGDEIYDRDILPKLRPEDRGKIVAVDTETGDYELAPDELTAAHGLRARRPDAQIWFRRVGSRYLHRFGHRRWSAA